MQNSKDKYLPYIDNFNQHMEQMTHYDGRLSSYATEAEIFATCSVYDIDIYVYKKENKNHEWQRFSPDEECLHQKEYMCLVNTSGPEHYDFIQRNARPCTCSISYATETNK